MTSVSTRRSQLSRPTSRSAARSLSDAELIARNSSDFSTLLQVAAAAQAAGNVEHTLLAAAFAARTASQASIGRLTDPHLEAVVAAAARGGGEAATVDYDRSDGHILHVITEASGTAGQSKSAVRWIANDATPADIAITHQSHVITVDVRTIVEGAGGYIHNLRKPARGGAKGVNETTLFDRAKSLRTAMNDADIVVLHTLAHDPVPLAAASLPGPRPPIITKNYFPDKFSLGWSVTDFIANCTAPGVPLTAQLRGVPAARQCFVPLPIAKATRVVSRRDLRDQMLFTDRDIVAICLAMPAKLESDRGPGFADLVGRLLKAVPELSVILVGPELIGPWKRLALRYPRRLHALGVLAEAQALFPVADLYLDSFPDYGPLAALDARAAGLPVVRLRNGGEASGTGNAGSVCEQEDRFDIDGYVSSVKRLARSQQLRQEHAAAGHSDAIAEHSGQRWDEAVESLYRQAHQPLPTAESRTTEPTPSSSTSNLPVGRPTRMTYDELIEPYRTLVDHQAGATLSSAWA